MKPHTTKFKPGTWLRLPDRFPLRQHRGRWAYVAECEPGPAGLMRLDVDGQCFVCTADEIGRNCKLD